MSSSFPIQLLFRSSRLEYVQCAFAVFLLLALYPSAGIADESDRSCLLMKQETGRIRDVSEFGEIILQSEKRLLIADTQFLQKPDQRELSGKTLKDLRNLLSGRAISFAVLGKLDRFKRLPAYIWFDDQNNEQIFLQKWLLPNTNVVVSPMPYEKIIHCGHRSLLQSLLAFENDLEKDTIYKFDRRKRYLYGANDGVLWQKEGEFAIVTGVVQTTYRSKSAANLNFGDNWKNDFTARLSSRVRAIIEMEHGPLEDMVGRQVRVRGILDLYNGPMIAIDHPEQLEFLAR